MIVYDNYEDEEQRRNDCRCCSGKDDGDGDGEDVDDGTDSDYNYDDYDDDDRVGCHCHDAYHWLITKYIFFLRHDRSQTRICMTEVKQEFATFYEENVF